MLSRSHQLEILRDAIVVALALAPFSAGAAQRDLSGTETFAAPDGTRLVVDSATVDVRFRTADIDVVEVATELHISGVGEERAEQWIASHTPVTEVGERRISVRVDPGRSGFLGLGTLTARARLGFLLPSHVAPDITTTSGAIQVRGDLPDARPLYLRTATGDMELIGAAGALDVRTASGDARFDLIRPVDRFFARTSSGSIDLSGGAREVHADTASGNVFMSNLSGDAEVITSTGKITLSWDRLEPGQRVVVRSSSGRIQLALPENVAPGGSLRSIGGTIRSDFPGTVNEAGDTITLTGDGPELLVETASGDVTLTIGTWWGGTSTATPAS